MAAPALVLLAAGLGSRFGGPKQIAPIGPNGSTLIDYAARDARAAGFDRLVLVVRGEIAATVEDHVRNHWPPELPAEFVRQDLEETAAAAVRSGRTKPLGTGHAILTAAPHLDGPFGVANADDHYGASGLATLARHLDAGGGHVLVGYRLANTLLGDRPVNRALCRVDGDGKLTALVEGEVRTGPDGLTWRPIGAPDSEAESMTGGEVVSVNLWGFTGEVVPLLEEAFDAFTAGGGIESGAELLLPTVVGDHLGPGGLDVTVLVSEERCLGVTHPDDVPLLQATLGGPAW
jgi:CTP:molybdopterin cytidylyltransferase MocA